MRTLLTIICFISFSSWGQTSKKLSDKFTLVTGRQYKGAILSADQHTPKLDETMTSRFTPTINEVDKLEKELKRRIKEINKNRPGQGRHYGPKVDKHLRRYIRQYIGFINDKNEKVIYVGLHWKGRAHNWKNDFVMVLDGGSYHWSIEFNLDRDEFFQFGVNGIASVPNGGQQNAYAIGWILKGEVFLVNLVQQRDNGAVTKHPTSYVLTLRTMPRGQF